MRYHVSRQLLFLRRAKKLRQKQVADAAGTSQPAIARIEAGEENITLDTVERLVNAMGGRFIVAIPPADYQIPVDWTEWWKPAVSPVTTDWLLVFTAVNHAGDRALVGLMRDTRPAIIGQGGAS